MAKTIHPLDLTRLESLQDLGQTVDPLQSLLQLSSSWRDIQKGAYEAKKTDFKNQQTFLQSQFINTKTLEGLNNQIAAIDAHNEKVESFGSEEYGINYKEKLVAFNEANLAYEKAKGIFDENIDDPDALAKKLLSGGWEGYAGGISNVNTLLDKIEYADKYGYRYRGEDKYSQKSLKKALQDRTNAHGAAFELLDSYGDSFNLMNADGSMDEESQALFDKLKFNIVTGDKAEVSSTINTGTTRAISGYNYWSKQYANWSKAELSVDKTLQGMGMADDSDMAGILNLNNYGESDELPDWFISDMKVQSLENAKKFNLQHKVYNGELYDNKPLWERLGITDEDLINMGVSSGPQLNDLNKDVDTDPLTERILAASEIKKEEETDITPVISKPEITSVKPVVGSPKYKQEKIKSDKISQFKKDYNIFEYSIDDLQNVNSKEIDDTLWKLLDSTEQIPMTTAKYNKVNKLRDRFLKELKFYQRQTEDVRKNPSIKKRLLNKYKALTKNILSQIS